MPVWGKKTCNYINAGIKYVVLYMEKNGFIDNKTNVLIVLLCRSALFEIYHLSRWGKKKSVLFFGFVAVL